MYQEAVELGTEGDIEWADTCDTDTGRLMMPVHNAYPCIEPWAEGTDNGGATAPGVTADEIVVINYKGQPDPLTQALVEDVGADTDPNAVNNNEIDYINMFADLAETYGRSIRLVTIEATGSPSDATAAQADALTGDRGGPVHRHRRPRSDTRVVAGPCGRGDHLCVRYDRVRRRHGPGRAVHMAGRDVARAGR